ncbi:MAG TPA: hypothetical protein VGO93_26545 [Candidatus Xenobia bacterium]
MSWTFLKRAVIYTLVLRLFFVLSAGVVARVALKETGTFLDALTLTGDRWDVQNYERIATLGAYDASHNQGGDLVFFPLYPLLVNRLMGLGLGFYWTAVLLSIVTQVTAGYLLQRLVALDYPEPLSRRAVAAFYLFPTAYFLMVPYTEGLFMTLVLGSLLAAREHEWAWAGAAAFGASLCRLVGVGLFPALLWEAWQARAGRRAVAWSLLCPLGLAGYLAVNWVCTGHPFYFMWAQENLFHYQSEWPWVTPWQQLRKIVLSPPNPDAWAIGMPHLIGHLASYAVPMWLWVRKIRPSYQVFCWIALIPATLSLFSPSLLRYLLPAFPIYMLAAAASDEIYLPWLGLSTLLMGAMSVEYLVGYWAN